jgi:tetratricopeptide (TPR) repeat protein
MKNAYWTGVLCLAASLRLGGQSPQMRVPGRIVATGAADRLQVEVYGGNGKMLLERIAVSPAGSFEVQMPETGEMVEMRVVTWHGVKVHSEYVTPRRAEPLEIRLPAATGPKTPGGAVSARRLAYKPSKEGKKWMREADKMAAEGDYEASVAVLERVVAKDAGWMEAWNNLATRRIVKGRFPEALEALAKAREIDPNVAQVHSNQGLAYLNLQRYGEALEAGRRAVALEPESAKAALVVGLALANLGGGERREEALVYLENAAREIVAARIPAAALHAMAGRREPAREHLEKYLASGHEAKREEAKALLRTLR